MSGSVKEIESSAYRNEFIDVLQRLVKAMPDYEELVFFVKVVKEHFLTDLKKGSPDIIVLGSNIPEELVLAAGKKHYWVLGGSRISSMWADDMVPRDTDPVSRSSLGYFKLGVAEKSLVLVPLVNDSTRKLAYMLKLMGLKVHTFHFPPLKNRDSIKEWNRQYEACRSAIAKHIKRPLTKRDLERTTEKVEQAKKQIREFLKASQGIMSGTNRMFILGSYYCAEDLDEWRRQLQSLTARLQKEKGRKENRKNKVLLLGSPVYFPNYKIPFLIEETGLELCLQADYTTLSIQAEACAGKTLEKGFSEAFYWKDTSPAYVRNDSLYRRIATLVSENEIDGIVYHVLKGQIEYDFELGRFEELFEKMNIPVFRLETDYNYQDVEQLRIRLEAFAEVLNQRNYSRFSGVGKGTWERKNRKYKKEAVAI